jgi:hypothetical protein
LRFPDTGVHAARMSIPGAVRSGCRISGVNKTQHLWPTPSVLVVNDSDLLLNLENPWADQVWPPG